ncbi:MAG TPA: hypothetical protein VFP65_19635 [Anaeromyxobacteraceae bacterium]|nr:hypothetical protein [Anaeromyxobacteraceae bacterium]
MGYTMRVVEIDSGREHELPADAVTRDSAGAIAPLLPLGFRPRGAVFFVTSQRWPELRGLALCAAGAAAGH